MSFNIDVVANSRDYPNNELLVTSYFHTIQGEGLYAGFPAIFLRLAGCNFGDKSNHCQFCDTNFQLQSARQFSVGYMAEVLRTMASTTGARLLVITGGEPFLQDAVLPLLQQLETSNTGSSFDVYQFETNGTVDKFAKKLLSLTEEWSIILEKLSVCVSPKANLATGTYAKIPHNMAKLVEVQGFYKFVVSADPNDPHHKVPEPFLDIAAEGLVRVYASPAAVYKKAPVGEVSSIWDTELVDQEATARNYMYAAQYVLHNPGLLLSLQTHLFTSVP